MIKPFRVMERDVTESGRPAGLNPHERSKTVWEIWDSTNRRVATCYGPGTAKKIKKLLNKHWKDDGEA